MIHKKFGDAAMSRRLDFAVEIDKKEPNACWASLVSWAGFGTPTSEFSRCFSQFCRPGRAPYAYCGKCRKYFGDQDETQMSEKKDKNQGLIKNCDVCGRFVSKDRWTRKDHPRNARPLCQECADGCDTPYDY